MEKCYKGYEGFYTIYQAAAGNWCVSFDDTVTEVRHFCCFTTEGEAYAFILGCERGVNPELCDDHEEEEGGA